VDVEGSGDSSIKVRLLWLLSEKHFNWEHASRYVKQRRTIKVLLKFLSVHRGTHDHNMQVRLTFLHYIFYQSKQDVSIEGPFMRLVEDNHTVSLEKRVMDGPKWCKVIGQAYDKGIICTSTYSRNSMPSVMYFRIVRPDVLSSKRMEYPTSSPKFTSISSATRLATLIAATRRGWVQAIPLLQSSNRSNTGIRTTLARTTEPKWSFHYQFPPEV